MDLLFGGRSIKWQKALLFHLHEIKRNQKKVLFEEILSGKHTKDQFSKETVLLELTAK